MTASALSQLKILVAVDTHKPTIYALRYANALALATQEKPQLTLFHAINAAIVIGMEGYGPVEHFKQDAHTIIKEAAGTLGRRGEDVELLEAAVVGNPADAVVQAAADGRFDLVVIGTHGRTGIGRLVLGSVAESVVKHSVVPTMVVRLPDHVREREDIPEAREIKKILCAVDKGGDTAIELVRSAAFYARSLGASVLLVHVHPEDNPREAALEGPSATLKELRAEFDKACHRSVKCVDNLVYSKKIGEKVLLVADTEQCDAIIMATHGHGGVSKLIIGSVAQDILRHARCPVIIIGSGKDSPMRSSQLLALESTKLF